MALQEMMQQLGKKRRPTIGSAKTPAFQTKNSQITILKKKISLLEQLMKNLDPYAPLSKANETQLKKFNILNLNDPYILTNQLILCLEESVQQLQFMQKNLGETR